MEDNSKIVSNDSETTTTVVPVMHAMTRAVEYSNSGPVDLFIIIEESEENQGEAYPRNEFGCGRRTRMPGAR